MAKAFRVVAKSPNSKHDVASNLTSQVWFIFVDVPNDFMMMIQYWQTQPIWIGPGLHIVWGGCQVVKFHMLWCHVNLELPSPIHICWGFRVILQWLFNFRCVKLNKYEFDWDFIFSSGLPSCQIPHLMLHKLEAPKSDSILLTFPTVKLLNKCQWPPF